MAAFLASAEALQLRLEGLQLVLGPVQGVVELAPLLARVGVAGLRDLRSPRGAVGRPCPPRARGRRPRRAAGSGPRSCGRGAGALAGSGSVVAGAGAGRLPSSPRPAASSGADGVDGLLGVRALGDQHHLVPEGDLDPHDGGDALGVGLVVAALEQDPGLELLGQVGEHRRRAGVQPGGVGDHDGLGGRPACPGPRAASARALGQGQGQAGILAGAHPPAGRDHRGHPLAVGDDHQGQQALGAGGQEVRIEGDQGVARGDRLPQGDLGGEALALQGHGVQADVHHHLDALGGGQGHRVPGVVELGHGPRRRGRSGPGSGGRWTARRRPSSGKRPGPGPAPGAG